MKRAFALILSLLICLTFICSCSNNEPNGTGNDTLQEQESSESKSKVPQKITLHANNEAYTLDFEWKHNGCYVTTDIPGGGSANGWTDENGVHHTTNYISYLNMEADYHEDNNTFSAKVIFDYPEESKQDDTAVYLVFHKDSDNHISSIELHFDDENIEWNILYNGSDSISVKHNEEDMFSLKYDSATKVTTAQIKDEEILLSDALQNKEYDDDGYLISAVIQESNYSFSIEYTEDSYLSSEAKVMFDTMAEAACSFPETYSAGFPVGTALIINFLAAYAF